jgi:hypothetical protein
VISPIDVIHGGPPTEASWALSVIVKYDPKPVERLTRIAQKAPFEGAFTSLVALKSLDRQTYEKLVSEWVLKLKAQSAPVDILLRGCLPYLTTADQILADIEVWQADAFLLGEIPPLEETIRLKRATPKEIAHLKAMIEEDNRAKDEYRRRQKNAGALTTP